MSKQQFVDFREVKQAVSMLQILDHYGLTDQMTRSGNGRSLSGKCPLFPYSCITTRCPHAQSRA
jgi:hypothetical protein